MNLKYWIALLKRVPCEQDCACPTCGMDYFKRLIGRVVLCLGCGKIYLTR